MRRSAAATAAARLAQGTRCFLAGDLPKAQARLRLTFLDLKCHIRRGFLNEPCYDRPTSRRDADCGLAYGAKATPLCKIPEPCVVTVALDVQQLPNPHTWLTRHTVHLSRAVKRDIRVRSIEPVA